MLQASLWKRVITSRWVLLALLVGAVFLVRAQYIQWQKRTTVNQEIARIKNQESEWLQKNKELEDSLAFLHSASYKEHVGRQQLNLKKDGEIVIGAVDGATKNVETVLPAQETLPASKFAAHLEGWWNYFFKH